MEYTEQVICYLDILGFKNLIKTSSPNKINEILEIPKLIVGKYKETIYHTQRHITFFSDTIVISFDKTARHQVYDTLTLIQEIIIEFIMKGVLCRGAVTIGKLIHNKNEIFGQGLIDAYQQEEGEPYPRILVDKQVLDLSEQYPLEKMLGKGEKQFVESLLQKDTDGKIFIDYLQSDFIDNYKNRIINTAHYNKVYNLIKENINSDNQRIKIKYEWLKEKYNYAVDNLKGKDNYLHEIHYSNIDTSKLCKID